MVLFEQKFAILMEFRLSCFVVRALEALSKTSFSLLWWQRVPPIFSSGSFIVFVFVLRSVIHAKIIFDIL